MAAVGHTPRPAPDEVTVRRALLLAVEQDGVIDNIIIAPAVHRSMGAVVLLAMLATAGWSIRLWVGGRPLDVTARMLSIVAQISLMLQALIGIKLLDQGMGVVQLYIHYVGGLIPLGLFILGSWLPQRTGRGRARLLAVLSTLGLLSAAMAFFIGRAYATGSLG